MVKRGDTINRWTPEEGPNDTTSDEVDDAVMEKALTEQYEQDAHATESTDLADVPLAKWLI